MADRLGKRDYYQFTAPGVSGAYQLDQSFHIATLAAAALLAA